jgi:hypothetical protein
LHDSAAPFVSFPETIALREQERGKKRIIREDPASPGR